jgi:uncharacterized protein (TIGR02611 family)
MLTGLKATWRRMARARPGERFQREQQRHRREHRSRVSRITTLVVGLTIMAAGVVALPAPGPGMLVIALGGALVARESALVARMLDGLEVRMRWFLALGLALWRRSPAFGKAVGALAGLCLTAVAAGFAWLIIAG